MHNGIIRSYYIISKENSDYKSQSLQLRKDITTLPLPKNMQAAFQLGGGCGLESVCWSLTGQGNQPVKAENTLDLIP